MVEWIALIVALISIALTIYYRYSDKRNLIKDNIKSDVYDIITYLIPVNGGNTKQAIVNRSERLFLELKNNPLHNEIRKQVEICFAYANDGEEIDLTTVKDNLRKLYRKIE